MREIIFRGQRLDTKEWVYGFVCRRQNDDSTYQYSIIEDTTLHIANVKQVVYIVNGETVGQFTGLTDKAGNKIWEGDVVAPEALPNATKFYSHVVFKDGMFFLKGGVLNPNNHPLWKSLLYGKESNCQYEIIGNLTDNPNYGKS